MNSNFRRHLLSLSLLVGVAVPWVATAQAPISNVGSGSIEDRVAQLGRISDAHSQLLTQLQQQVADSQRDIDSLRGQIQENQYQLSQVVERQKQIYQQMDSLSGQQSSGSTTTGTTGSASAPVATGATTAAASASSGDENSDYNEAVALVLEKKQYDQAIDAFQRFVKQYPNSTYQPNANYWLGQLSYNKGNRDDAAHYFAVVVTNYPKSPKSSEALLKVGVIFQDKGEVDKAKAVYQKVVQQYPNTDAAKQAQKRLSAL